jgi:hypothetical protein
LPWAQNTIGCSRGVVLVAVSRPHGNEAAGFPRICSFPRDLPWSILRGFETFLVS